jgi:hypothetical protein
VRVDGSVYAYGLDAPGPSPLSGGNGAPVTISGADVRTGSIDATAGNGVMAPAGNSAAIKLSASGSITLLGRLDASGQGASGAAGGPASSGAPITLSAAGPLTAAGGIYSTGATSRLGGTAGGAISIGGATITADTADVRGGDAPGSGLYGAGPAGSITAGAPGGASFGSLLASGGNAYSGGAPGAGGSISVTGSGGSIAANTVLTQAGYTGNGAGGGGGPITLSASQNLTVGTVNANGSDAGGAADPPRGGGNAGNLTLRAADGTLSLEGNVSASGGAGGSNSSGTGLGGPGGNGGQVEVIAHAVGPVASLSSAGGDGGDYGANQGPGGLGGAIWAWTNAPLFDDQQLVTSDGGNGNPTGTAGKKHQDSSPTALSIGPSSGLLSFTSQSPDASGYAVLESQAGAAPRAVLQTTSSANLRPPAPLCVPVTLTVVAVNGAVQWTSDPSPSVAYTRPPSATQGCSDAPRIAAVGHPHVSMRRLRRGRWAATVLVTIRGIGSLQAAVKPARGAHPGHSARRLRLAVLQITRSGRHRLHLLVPAADRAPGTYVIRVLTISPNGKGHRTTTMTLRIGS